VLVIGAVLHKMNQQRERDGGKYSEKQVIKCIWFTNVILARDVINVKIQKPIALDFAVYQTQDQEKQYRLKKRINQMQQI
jgi:hypothetical protein